VFDAGLPESCLRHSPDTVGTRVVEPPFLLDQHIQAHQKPEHVPGSIVVDDRLVDDEGSAVRDRLEGSSDQKLFLFRIPVVENVAHHHDIDLWQGIVEETSRGEVEPVRQAVLSDVGVEDGAHLGKVEAQICRVGMSEGDLDGEVTLGGSRIDEGLVVRPRKLCGDRNVRATTDARYRGKELFELGRIGLQGVEERFTAARGFIIGLPRS